MSHRRLALVALGAASLLAAAVPSAHAAPPLEPQLVNLRIAEADAPNASALIVNVALDRPNPFPFPVSVGVGDYTHIVVRGSSPPRTYGTATAGSDYKAITPFRLEWAPGQQVARFAVSLYGDTVDEPDENINIRISGPSAGIDIGDNDIDIVVADNDPLGTTNPFAMPLVQFPNAQLSEPDAGCLPYLVSLHLARPAPYEGSVVVRDYTLTHGSATPGVDYVTFAPFRLYFPAGANSARFPVQVCGDTDLEADEEIDIRAAAPAGVQLVDNDLDLVLRNND